ncbi:MAG: hypothetical protein KAJ06_07545 [Gammaproteobacteria bacterium]|nr:hypothetical protein [Gammaproteobacteria bacterium]
MSARTLFSIVESPAHPDFSRLYKQLEIREVRLASMRKAISALKQHSPDYVVAEFYYGYGNNYAGVNVSNLDVFLYSLQKYAPDARVIVLVDRRERQFVEKLSALFTLYAVLQQPVREQDIAPLFGD